MGPEFQISRTVESGLVFENEFAQIYLPSDGTLRPGRITSGPAEPPKTYIIAGAGSPDPADYQQEDPLKIHNVRCCDGLVEDSGWVAMSAYCGPGTSCAVCTDKTYAEADQICKAAGLNLCSREQMLNGVPKGSGCSFDFVPVWVKQEDIVVEENKILAENFFVDGGANATSQTLHLFKFSPRLKEDFPQEKIYRSAVNETVGPVDLANSTVWGVASSAGNNEQLTLNSRESVVVWETAWGDVGRGFSMIFRPFYPQIQIPKGSAMHEMATGYRVVGVYGSAGAGAVSISAEEENATKFNASYLTEYSAATGIYVPVKDTFVGRAECNSTSFQCDVPDRWAHMIYTAPQYGGHCQQQRVAGLPEQWSSPGTTMNGTQQSSSVASGSLPWYHAGSFSGVSFCRNSSTTTPLDCRTGRSYFEFEPRTACGVFSQEFRERGLVDLSVLLTPRGCSEIISRWYEDSDGVLLPPTFRCACLAPLSATESLQPVILAATAAGLDRQEAINQFQRVAMVRAYSNPLYENLKVLSSSTTSSTKTSTTTTSTTTTSSTTTTTTTFLLFSLNQPTSGSFQGPRGAPSHVVDGIIYPDPQNPGFPTPCTTSPTYGCPMFSSYGAQKPAGDLVNPWWQVDLGPSPKWVSYIKVFGSLGRCAHTLVVGRQYCETATGSWDDSGVGHPLTKLSDSFTNPLTEGATVGLSLDSTSSSSAPTWPCSRDTAWSSNCTLGAGAGTTGVVCGRITAMDPRDRHSLDNELTNMYDQASDSRNEYLIECNAWGRYAWVMLPGSTRYLELIEVQVWGSLAEPATTSSTTTTTTTTLQICEETLGGGGDEAGGISIDPSQPTDFFERSDPRFYVEVSTPYTGLAITIRDCTAADVLRGVNSSQALTIRSNFCDMLSEGVQWHAVPTGATHMQRFSIPKFRFSTPSGAVNNIFLQCRVTVCLEQPCGLCSGTSPTGGSPSNSTRRGRMLTTALSHQRKYDIYTAVTKFSVSSSDDTALVFASVVLDPTTTTTSSTTSTTTSTTTTTITCGNGAVRVAPDRLSFSSSKYLQQRILPVSPEIMLEGQWYPICGHCFSVDPVGAFIFCQKLGFGAGSRPRHNNGVFNQTAMQVGLCLWGDSSLTAFVWDGVRAAEKKWFGVCSSYIVLFSISFTVLFVEICY